MIKMVTKVTPIKWRLNKYNKSLKLIKMDIFYKNNPHPV
jgi:hypothetical protein